MGLETSLQHAFVLDDIIDINTKFELKLDFPPIYNGHQCSRHDTATQQMSHTRSCTMYGFKISDHTISLYLLTYPVMSFKIVYGISQKSMNIGICLAHLILFFICFSFCWEVVYCTFMPQGRERGIC